MIERYGPTEDCGGCFRKSQHHSERCRARFELLCAGEDGLVEVRAQEGQPAPPDPAGFSIDGSPGGVNPQAMEAEDAERATSSPVLALAAPIRPFVTGDDETMEQEGPESKRQRTVAGLPVCSLAPLVDEIPVSYVATHEIDERPVYDQKTGERLAPHLLEVGRPTECEAMIRHQLFECVPTSLARGWKVRCQWLDEMKEGTEEPLVCSRLVEMEVAHGMRFDTFAGTAHLTCIKIISRATSIKNKRGRRTRMFALHDSALRFGTRSYHTSQLRCIRCVVKRKRDTCGR